jgi:hypothetical protein
VTTERAPLAELEEHVRARHARLDWHRAAAASANAAMEHAPDSHEAVRRASAASRQVQEAYAQLVAAQQALRARCPDCHAAGLGCVMHTALLAKR